MNTLLLINLCLKIKVNETFDGLGDTLFCHWKMAMNKEKITASSVNKFIRENAPRNRLWDSELGGFYLLSLTDGRGAWRVKYRGLDGKPREATIGQYPAMTPEQEYDHAVNALNELLDAGGADEHHPLAVLVTLLSDFIADYEDKQTPRPTIIGRAMLAFLMEQHGLKQAALSEIGSQGVVSELLSGKRELTTKHIKLLASRFNVPVSVFIQQSL